MNKSDNLNGLITKYAAHYRKTKKLISNSNAYVLFEYLMDDSLMKTKNGDTNLSIKASKSTIGSETGLKDGTIRSAYKLLEEYELIKVKSSKDGTRNTYIINHKYYSNLMNCFNTLNDYDKEDEFCKAFRNRDKGKLKAFGYREFEQNCELASTKVSAPFIIDTIENDTNSMQQSEDIVQKQLHEAENLIKNVRTILSQKGVGAELKESALFEKPCQKGVGAESKEHTDNNIINKKMKSTNEMSRYIGGETKKEDERERDVLSEKEPNLASGESSDSFSSSDINLLPDKNQRNIEKQEEIDKIEWDEFMNIETSSDYNKEETKYSKHKKIKKIVDTFRDGWKIKEQAKFSEMQDYLIMLMRDFEIMRIDGYLYSDPKLLEYLFPELKEDAEGKLYRSKDVVNNLSI